MVGSWKDGWTDDENGKRLVSPLQLNFTHRWTTITKISPPRSQNPAASAHLLGLVSPPVMLCHVILDTFLVSLCLLLCLKILKTTAQSNVCTHNVGC